MESNLEDNITQSQSEKNPQKSKGNSRRKKILCKKHETGRKGQNEVNSSENNQKILHCNSNMKKGT